MAGKKIELGASGKVVAANVKRLRNNREYKWLSQQLQALGRDITPLAIRRIEESDRRVDVDDLIALAVALEVSPATLLTPHTGSDPEERVELNGVEMPVAYLWGWLRGDNELPRPDENGIPAFSAVFLSRALPPWRFAELEKEWARNQAHFNAAAARKHGNNGDDQ